VARPRAVSSASTVVKLSLGWMVVTPAAAHAARSTASVLSLCRVRVGERRGAGVGVVRASSALDLRADPGDFGDRLQRPVGRLGANVFGGHPGEVALEAGGGADQQRAGGRRCGWRRCVRRCAGRSRAPRRCGSTPPRRAGTSVCPCPSGHASVDPGWRSGCSRFRWISRSHAVASSGASCGYASSKFWVWMSR
jgi:hypothetical protein